jgi:hypothetical protein
VIKAAMQRSAKNFADKKNSKSRKSEERNTLIFEAKQGE